MTPHFTGGMNSQSEMGGRQEGERGSTLRSSSPTVSVVIPVYNGAALLERALESVRAQRYTDYEVLVVDDGSADGSAAVAARYLAQPGVVGRCLRQSHRQVAAARNAGIREARGAYIALLDHDDLWYPDKLRVVMAEFARHPEAGLVCHDEHIVRDGRRLRTARNGPAVDRMYERLLFSGNTLCVSSTVFRRDSALAIGGFREDPRLDTVEDYDFWLRLSRTARFRFIPEVLGAYQVVDRSSSSRIAYLHTNLECLLKDHLDSYFGSPLTPAARWRMRRRLATVYRSAATQLMRHGEDPDQQQAYVLRMLRTYPLSANNLIRAGLWTAKAVREALQSHRGQHHPTPTDPQPAPSRRSPA